MHLISKKDHDITIEYDVTQRTVRFIRWLRTHFYSEAHLEGDQRGLPEVSHHLIIPEAVIESALDNEVIDDLCIQVGHRLNLILAPAFKFELAKQPALDSL